MSTVREPIKCCCTVTKHDQETITLRQGNCKDWSPCMREASDCINQRGDDEFRPLKECGQRTRPASCREELIKSGSPALDHLRNPDSKRLRSHRNVTEHINEREPSLAHQVNDRHVPACDPGEVRTERPGTQEPTACRDQATQLCCCQTNCRLDNAEERTQRSKPHLETRENSSSSNPSEFNQLLLKWHDRQNNLPLRRRKRSEEHTSELQSHHDLVCRLLLEK